VNDDHDEHQIPLINVNGKVTLDVRYSAKEISVWSRYTYAAYWICVDRWDLPQPLPSRRRARAVVIKAYAEIAAIRLGYPFQIKGKL